MHKGARECSRQEFCFTCVYIECLLNARAPHGKVAKTKPYAHRRNTPARYRRPECHEGSKWYDVGCIEGENSVHTLSHGEDASGDT